MIGRVMNQSHMCVYVYIYIYVCVLTYIDVYTYIPLIPS